MAELKTKKTEASAADFLGKIKDAGMRRDCDAIVDLMQRITGAGPKMWGPSIIGFGDRRLKYPSGREIDWMVAGFSPRKAAIVLYLPGEPAKHAALLKKLGKHSTGKGCLYIRKLADVDTKVLDELIRESVRGVKPATPSGGSRS